MVLATQNILRLTCHVSNKAHPRIGDNISIPCPGKDDPIATRMNQAAVGNLISGNGKQLIFL